MIHVKRLFKDHPEVWMLRLDIHPNCKGVASFFVEGEAEPKKVPLEDIGIIS